MAVYSTLIAIQASTSDGRGIAASDFLDPLAITDDDAAASVTATGEEWQSGLVEFEPVRLRDFGGDSEAMFERLHDTFSQVAAFLDRRDVAVFGSFRDKGLDVQLFVDVWMDADQMECNFLASLVSACGRHGLAINMISNDISVAEIEASGGT